MRIRSLAIVLALLTAAVLGPAPGWASLVHVVNAAGAGVCSLPPCTDDHREGHYTNGGVPGVNADYSYYNSKSDSAFGYMTMDAGWSWLEGASRPSSFSNITDAIEETLVLTRIAPGPVTIRATMILDGGANVAGSGLVTLSGTLSLAGCQASASRDVSFGVSGDLVPVGGCGELIGSALVATVTYDDQLPTEPQLYAELQAEYFSFQKGTVVDLEWRGDFYFEVLNATPTWTTQTFLTQAPEPSGEALGVAVIAVLAMRGARSRHAARSR